MDSSFWGFVRYAVTSPLFYIWILFLQILLSTRKNKFLGIILPSIFILYSIIVGLYFLAIQHFSELAKVSDRVIFDVFIYSFFPGIVLLGVFVIFLVFYRKRS